MGCMIDSDPTLAELSRLQPCWSATRASPDQPWLLEEHEDSDNPEGA